MEAQEHIKNQQQLPWRARISNHLVPITVVTFVFILAAILMNTPFVNEWRSNYVKTSSLSKSWEPHTEYRKQGKLLWRIASDPQLTSGQPFSYMIDFSEPYQQFAGKTLSIRATHKATGTQMTIIPEAKLGQQNLDRVTFTSGLPLAGLWKYEVEWNGEFYGEVVLDVQDLSWDVSPTFNLGSSKLRGVQQRLAIMDTRFRVGGNSRYLWYFWGSDQELTGKFKVMALKEGSSELIELYTAPSLSSPRNGADRVAVSTLSLPNEGRWRIMAIINEQLFGSVVVEAR